MMENKPRKPWVAGVLTVAGIGLGHVYAGSPKRGLVLYLINVMFGVACAAVASFFVPNIVSLSAMVLAGIAFGIYCIYDAARTAQPRRDSYELAKYNRWYVYVGYFIVLSLVINSTVSGGLESRVKAYKLPSGSMEPTLLIGDRILVDRRPTAREPKRGDIVVFEWPEDPSKDFIKRVVAVGGDTVEVRDKQLLVNGQPVNEPYIVHNEPDMIPASENPRDNFGPLTVSPGTYFTMGDNRDRAYDSRFWGTVPQAKIRGTVRSIYWSWDQENGAVRWSRIGMKVQ